jgi:hypothetical protein
MYAFARGTRDNTTEKAGYGTNVVAASNSGKDYKDVYNRVFVYGNTVEDSTDVYFFKSIPDVTSQTSLWTRDKVINDTNVKNNNEAANLAAVNIVTTPYRRGTIQCAGGLLTLQPGERIGIQLPYMELQGMFSVGEYFHSWNTSGMNTSLSVDTLVENIARLFQERVLNERNTRKSQNDNFMLESTIYSFADEGDTESHNNTMLSNSTLMMQPGFSTGIWTSVVLSLSNDCTTAEVRVNGSDLNASTFEVSLDNGQTWTIVPGNVPTAVGAGNIIKTRVTLNVDANNPEPKVWTLGVMTK